MDKVAGGAVRLFNGKWMPKMGYGTFKCLGATVQPALECALTTGYRLIDTARFYQNEADLGDALKSLLPKLGLSRSDIFLTTKLEPASKQETLTRIDEQLPKLQTDYLDLILIHYPKAFRDGANDDPKNPEVRRQTWEALEQRQSEGRIVSIGVSNYEPRHIEELLGYAKVQPAVNQCEFHPHMTRDELRAYCATKDIHFQAFTSLARNDPQLIDEPVLQAIATQHSATAHQVLLAWALAQGVSVVPKSQSPERIATNFAAIQLRLSDDQVGQLTALNRNTPYTACQGWNVL